MNSGYLSTRTNAAILVSLVVSSAVCAQHIAFANESQPSANKLNLKQAMHLGREKPFSVRLARELASEAQARASQALGALFSARRCRRSTHPLR